MCAGDTPEFLVVVVLPVVAAQVLESCASTTYVVSQL